MKYDKKTKWDSVHKQQTNRSFQQGYKEGYQEWRANPQYLKQNPKDPYVVGYLQGKAAIKKDKMKELVSGKPRRNRFHKQASWIPWDDSIMDAQTFITQGTVTGRWSSGSPDDLESATKTIAEMIDEGLIKNE